MKTAGRKFFMTKLIMFVVFLGFLGFAWGAIAAAPENTVIRIKDGDTVVIMGAKRKPYTVRLAGIDAPEDGQAWGRKSKKLLKKLIHKKIVRVVPQKKADKWGRVVARLYIGNIDVCAYMVENGGAWVYRRYARGSSFAVFYRAEEAAQKNKVGLWAAKNPVPPWKWRKLKKKK